MTGYVPRVTIACPEAVIGGATQFALVIRRSAADAATFAAAGYRNAAGNRHASASTVATSGFKDEAGNPLSAPDHAPGADLTAAGPGTGGGGNPAPGRARPG